VRGEQARERHREMERLYALGRTQTLIAVSLGMPAGTVGYHLANHCGCFGGRAKRMQRKTATAGET